MIDNTENLNDASRANFRKIMAEADTDADALDLVSDESASPRVVVAHMKEMVAKIAAGQRAVESLISKDYGPVSGRHVVISNCYRASKKELVHFFDALPSEQKTETLMSLLA